MLCVVLPLVGTEFVRPTGGSIAESGGFGAEDQSERLGGLYAEVGGGCGDEDGFAGLELDGAGVGVEDAGAGEGDEAA